MATKRNDAKILRRWDKGMNGPQIARDLGIGNTTVYKVLYRAGISPSQAEGRPKSDHRNKLTTAEEVELVRLYTEGEPLRSIARSLGCSTATVTNIAKRHGAPLRPVGGARRKWTDDEIGEMRRLYDEGMSQPRLADRFHTSQITISRLLRMRGGLRAHRFLRSGGRMIVNGYWYVIVYPEDPMASMRNSIGYVLEHRLVLARDLGRPLTEYETVHHINGDKLDNRRENLQLRQSRHGKGVVHRCLDCGSTNVEAVTLA